MSSWLNRYLRLLKLPELEQAAPSLEVLGRLTRAQVMRVPFENVTSILRRAPRLSGPVPSLDTDATLDAWQAGAAGGVCVDATPMFRRLLIELGFDTRAILAQISFPGSHQASVVTLDNREYLVDTANGAPFFEPIPLDQQTEIHRAGLGWRFRRETHDILVQDRLIQGEWQPFCRYGLNGVGDAEVEAAYQHHHVPGVSWVVGNLTLVRCFETEVVRLRDNELLRYSTSGSTVEHVDAVDLPALAADVFGLPALPIGEAIAALEIIRAAPAA